MFARLATYRRRYLDRHDVTCRSESEFRDFYQRAGLVPNVPYPRTVVVLLPLLVFISGVLLWTRTGRHPPDILLWLGFVSFELFVLLGSIYWFDTRFPPVIVALATAFRNDTATYYDLMGRMVQRWYDVNILSRAPKRRYVHLPMVGLWTAISVFGVWLVESQFPLTQFSLLWWHTVSVFFLIAGFVATVGWVLLVTLYYMSYHISEQSDLAIRIDVTKRIDRLGLRPFGIFLTKATLISVFNMVVVTAVVIPLGVPLPLTIPLIAEAIVSVVPFFAFQYGLHKLIRRAKREQIRNLTEIHGEELTRWFDGPIDTSADPDAQEVESVVIVKQEIDNLPEWPADVTSVATVLAASLGPSVLNLLVSLTVS